MDMQDKEFDAIFRSKLDGFEAEPSARVWDGIGEELSSSHRRAIFMPILRIAAIIIVLITAGLLFIPRGGKVRPGKADHTIAKAAAPAVKQPGSVAPVKQPEPVKAVVQQPDVNSIARVANERKRPQPVKSTQKDITIDTPIPEVVQKVEPQQGIAAIEPPKKSDIVQPVVPGPETQLSAKTADVTQTKATPQVIAQVPPTDQAAKPAKRRGIHNFGDLVNLVVDKVDKRKDKAIRFSDSDDDESTITSVNIGPVKINKDVDK